MFQTAHTSRTRAALSTIGDVEHKLLHATGTYPFLTADQAAKLCRYSPRSITHVREKLKRLADLGFVVRFDKVRPFGIPLAHVLSTKGSRYVASTGGAVTLTLQPREIAEKSPYFILHTQAVNDVLINAALLQETVPYVVLTRMRHELELKHQPVYVEVTTSTRDGQRKRERIGLIADGILDFLTQQEWQDFITVEVYRSFIDEKRWKEKVRAYIVYLTDHHQTLYGTEALTIAVFAMLGDKLRDTLRRWTEEELNRIQAAAQGARFLFRSINPATVAPEDMFLAPEWHQAFGDHPQPLLVLEEAGSS